MAASPARKPVPPELLELTSGLFSLVLSLRRAADLGQESVLRERITSYFAGFEREAQDHGYLREDVDLVRFALAAFVDEVILDSTWNQSEQWRHQPLQLDLFKERRAGQRFFDELNQLRRQGEAKHQVVAVYHQCLNLGFEGQYRVSGRDQLVQLKIDLDHQLGYDARDRRELKLSPHGKRPDAAYALDKDRFPFWPLFALGCGALITLYIILYFRLQNETELALSAISSFIH